MNTNFMHTILLIVVVPATLLLFFAVIFIVALMIASWFCAYDSSQGYRDERNGTLSIESEDDAA